MSESTTDDPLPVARVLVDVPLPHLDRPFDYAVPEVMSATAVPGARVKVRFGGRDVTGYVVERVATSDQKLRPLSKVVSAEPVLAPEIEKLVAAVAARYAGTRSDVLRLAIPGRHARAEAAESKTAAPTPAPLDLIRWTAYTGGPAFLDRLGEGARAVLSVLPGDDWAELYADAIVTAATKGLGVLALVPDARDLARLDAALVARWGKKGHLTLVAEAGPQRRYTNFLAVRRGAVRVVIGTRAAAFAPVHDLGLVAIWDDGDDLYDEPRAPYPHAREVLLLRAHETGCAALLGGYAQSVEARSLVRAGWAQDVTAPRETVRERVAVSIAGADERVQERDAARTARLPGEAFEAVRTGLATGPVLVQTPRAGYVPRLACERCRTPARCPQCDGPLRLGAANAAPSCTWCGTVFESWRCPECLGRRLRAPVVGSGRTAEELGRAFPGVPVVRSSGESVTATVTDKPAIVVSTPGAEPVADAGYAAVLLLDAWLSVGRGGLRGDEEAFRRWANAAALVRPAKEGARVVVVGDPALPALQALVRWDPAGFADREIDERSAVHLPPVSVVATLTGGIDDIAGVEAALREELKDVAGLEILGPVPVDPETARLIARVPRAARTRFARGLRDVQAARSLKKMPHVRVRVDPRDLG